MKFQQDHANCPKIHFFFKLSQPTCIHPLKGPHYLNWWLYVHQVIVWLHKTSYLCRHLTIWWTFLSHDELTLIALKTWCDTSGCGKWCFPKNPCGLAIITLMTAKKLLVPWSTGRSSMFEAFWKCYVTNARWELQCICSHSFSQKLLYLFIIKVHTQVFCVTTWIGSCTRDNTRLPLQNTNCHPKHLSSVWSPPVSGDTSCTSSWKQNEIKIFFFFQLLYFECHSYRDSAVTWDLSYDICFGQKWKISNRSTHRDQFLRLSCNMLSGRNHIRPVIILFSKIFLKRNKK